MITQKEINKAKKKIYLVSNIIYILFIAILFIACKGWVRENLILKVIAPVLVFTIVFVMIRSTLIVFAVTRLQMKMYDEWEKENAKTIQKINELHDAGKHDEADALIIKYLHTLQEREKFHVIKNY